MSGSEWDIAFEARAQAYWKPERLAELMRGKQLLVTPANAPQVLRAMGLLHGDGSMPPRQARKFFQLNHMLWLLGPPLRELMSEHESLRIIDAGCGGSYLTFALAWCLQHEWNHPAQILGIDRNAKLIDDCKRRASLCGLDNIDYAVGDLASVELGEADVHAIISLHACDTATDDAIVLGVSRGAKLIAVAPCCQAELAAKWALLAENGELGAFEPMWTVPHLRREVAATMTDAFRALLLEASGYETRTVEFVGSEHTPKNTLIRAMQRGEPRPEALRRYRELRLATGNVGIALEGRLSLG